MLVRSGMKVLKYWFSVSWQEQRRRFESRNEEPLKRWKLSDIDLEHPSGRHRPGASRLVLEGCDVSDNP
jgi:polyphosphate kinase 2 (PPK2 family)